MRSGRTSAYHYYQDLAGASRTLEAKIRFADGRADDLPADDHAYALMPERHRARVLVISKGNTYLEAALLLDEYLDVTTVVPGKPLPSEHFDVAILDGVADALRTRWLQRSISIRRKAGCRSSWALD
ncbi:MAG: hypothetical protein WDO74_24515 [Pseudomonadota bacterium]